MTYQEYKSRHDKLIDAIVNWMMRESPDTERLNHVMTRAQNTMELWWNQIENDAAVLIVNKLINTK